MALHFGETRESLPVWEEWIEIYVWLARSDRIPRLFPYGKSGLKFDGHGGFRILIKSLPVWEEWIEMSGA